ncbi:MAG TPA: O-methyltransferase [Candidatus Eisenbacteria bacterium]|nr:O-methyltransferase [Candidatus Eisenbacteria bacterium]
MDQETWNAVDRYYADLLLPPDAALDQAVEASARAGLPAIQVQPNQGKLLQLIARAQGARAILEIGTLGGYSTIWLARALAPGGRLVTLEFDPHHAAVATANIARAGLADRVQVRVGRALDALPQLEREGLGPFDLVFIDADKPTTTEYFEWGLKLSRPGSLIVVDNVVRDGRIANGASADPDVLGIRRFNERLAREPRVDATAIQMVGPKGYDGMVIALVTR